MSTYPHLAANTSAKNHESQVRRCVQAPGSPHRVEIYNFYRWWWVDYIAADRHTPQRDQQRIAQHPSVCHCSVGCTAAASAGGWHTLSPPENHLLRSVLRYSVIGDAARPRSMQIFNQRSSACRPGLTKHDQGSKQRSSAGGARPGRTPA